MIASLPMYDWPELRPATDALWAGLRAALIRHGFDAPETLERGRPPEAQWRDPELLLSQTCGYPYATTLRGAVRLVATPVYEAEGCDGPLYSSAIVVRAEDAAGSLPDLAGRRAACNAPHSQSGYSAFRAAIAPLAAGARFFAATHETGGHLASMEAVTGAQADCAAIDAVVWALARRHRPDLAARLRVLAWSDPAPALPLVTAASRTDEEMDAMRAALEEVLVDPDLAEARATLCLARVVALDDRAYDAILDMERGAVAAGYPALA